MNPSRHPVFLIISLSILLASTFTLAGNVIVRNGQLNVSAGIYSDSDTLYVDSENNLVGIGTTSPGGKLSIVSPAENWPTLGNASGSLRITGQSEVWGMYQGLYSSTGGGWIQVMRGDSATAYNLAIQPVGGNVGIGTTNPGYKLDVISSGEEVFRIQTTKSGDTYYKIFNLLAPNQTDGEAVQISLGHELGSGEVGEIAFFKEASGNYLALGTYGAGNTVAIASSGNVGIGTTSPGEKLSVHGNISLRVGSIDEAVGDVISWAGRAYITSVLTDPTYEDSDRQGLAFYTHTTGASADPAVESMRITNKGNVGIGTTDPRGLLELSSNTEGTQRPNLVLSNEFDGLEHSVNDYYYLYHGNQGCQGEGLFIGYNTSYEDPCTSNDKLMTILNNGSVGIGTIYPEGKFDVEVTSSGEHIHFDSPGTDRQRIVFEELDTDYFALYHDGSSTSPNNLFKIMAANGADGVLDVTAVTIKQNGYIGIGTTTPNTNLEVSSGSTYGGVAIQISSQNNHILSNAYWNVSQWDRIKTDYGSFNIWHDQNGDTVVFRVVDNGSNPINWINALGINAMNGYVGIGTTSPESKLQVTGGGLCVGSDANCNSDNNNEGVVYSSSTAMTQYDVAENYPTRENLTAGDVLVLDLQNPVFVKKSSIAYDPLVMGVVSESPGVILGGFNGQQYINETQVAVALAGRVPVKASNVNGDIGTGDLLTPSDIPGTAMKCDGNCGLGTVVGKALEPCESDSCEILVLVALR